jgi:hypothetical protein
MDGKGTGSENPHAGQGSVLLDIGGDVGALVIAMPPTMLGAEVEIAPVGGHEQGHDHRHEHGHPHRPHVAVVNRPVTKGTVPSLVFPELVEGSYELFGKGEETVLLTAEITGGQVTFLAWPAQRSGG